MTRNPQGKELSRAKYFWVGLGLVLTGTVFLVLCNYDDYHFFWLLGFLRVSFIFGFVMLGLSLAPSSLADYLLQDRSRIGSLGLKALLACFLWIGSFMILGIAYQLGLKALDDSLYRCSAHVDGRVVAVDLTSSKGGSVEWAVYEYSVGGSLFKSAVRNKSLGLQPGQTVRVCYTSFWPRRNKVHSTLQMREIVP